MMRLWHRIYINTIVLVVLLLASVEAIQENAFSHSYYVKNERAFSDTPFILILGIKPRDRILMEEKLWDISDPTRRHTYGEHLTRQEANSLSLPSNEALDSIYHWLKPSLHVEHGDVISALSPATNIIRLHTTVGKVERLLQTELHKFQHRHANTKRFSRKLIRAARPIYIPSHLHEFLTFSNVNSHPFVLHPNAQGMDQNVQEKDWKLQLSLSREAGSEKSKSMIELIQQTYGIPADLVVQNETNKQAIPSFYDEAWSPHDLTLFFDSFLPNEDQKPKIEEIGGRLNTPERATIEASLDLQYITALARNTTTYVFTMKGRNPNSDEDEPFLEFAEAILDMDNPPYVVSMSYSDDEEEIFRVGADYAYAMDTLLIKMGLRGISVLVASGDDGVSGLRPRYNDVSAKDTCLKNGPQWPTSSPYITTVGATVLLSSVKESGSVTLPPGFYTTSNEVVCSAELQTIITSGGAFSNIYSMPEYQKKLVSAYLESSGVPTESSFFNSSGRAYPDISALGAWFEVYINGITRKVTGTSASTPVVSAMVTLWNDLLLNKGLKPLGFLNPLIYFLAEKHPTAFHDITIGHNGATKNAKQICKNHFAATVGWDASTGVGSPKFQVIADLILNMDNITDDSVSLDKKMYSTNDNNCSVKVGSITLPLEGTIGILAVIISALGILILSAFILYRLCHTRWGYKYATLESISTGPESVCTLPNESIADEDTNKLKNDSSENPQDEMTEISLA